MHQIILLCDKDYDYAFRTVHFESSFSVSVARGVEKFPSLQYFPSHTLSPGPWMYLNPAAFGLGAIGQLIKT